MADRLGRALKVDRKILENGIMVFNVSMLRGDV